MRSPMPAANWSQMQEARDPSRLASLPSMAFAAALFCLLALFLGAATAQAAPGYKQVGGFGTGTIESTPPAAAVDEATGNVLVASSGGNKVQVFDSAGPGATLISEFGGGGALDGPSGIAIDQSNGDVYVNNSGRRVVRFLTDGANPPTYTKDPTYTGPAFRFEGLGPSGEIANFDGRIAVDPRNGDLLLIEPFSKTVLRYTSAGTYVSSFNGADIPAGALYNPVGLTVAANGDIYVVDVRGFIGSFGEHSLGAVSRIDRFAADGTFLEAVGGKAATNAVSIAYDPVADNVVFGSQFGSFSKQAPELTVLHGGATVAELPIEGVGPATVPAIAAGDAAGTVYAVTGAPFFEIEGEVPSVQVFESHVFPGLDPLSSITTTGATGSGTVYPAGIPTEYWLEYRPVGASAWSTTAKENAGTGAEAHVSVQLTGLDPNREYQVRLVSSNASEELRTGAIYFTTLAAAPFVATGGSAEVTQTSAYLRGTVTPYGLQTTYHFEYGTTLAYGASAPVGVGDVAGQARVPLSVGPRVSRLQPGTTYHYRLVAENSAGETLGEDRTFTTKPAGPQRAFELITPIAKKNVSVSKVDTTIPLIRADGESIVYGTEKATYPGANATFYIPRVVSKRSPEGWSTQTIDPPVNNSSIGDLRFFGTSAVSEDQSRALISTNRALTPGAVETVDNNGNLYIKDLATGELSFIATGNISMFQYNGPNRFLGGTPDLSTVVFYGLGKLLPEASESGSLYEWREGAGLSLVSTAPDGTAFENVGEQSLNLHDPNMVSRDGSKVYFNAGSPGPPAVYLHTRGAPSKLISVSHRPGDPATPVSAQFIGASPDGRYAVFTTPEANDPLTTDAPASQDYNAYLYDDASGSLTYLASSVPSGAAKPIFTPAGDMVFWSSGGLGSQAMYYVHDGVSKEILGSSAGWFGNYTYSPNGRFFIFSANGEINGFDNNGFDEVYRFDTASEELTCVSCRIDGGKPTGNASLGEESPALQFQNHGPQTVLDDGTVYFDTPDPLLPADANGARDVYAYEGDQLTLISPGDAETDAEIAGASPDGANVFFRTPQPLVARDIDKAVDLYDARVGGGIAWQNEAPSKGCESEDCRTSYATPAPFQPLGSEGIDEAGKGGSARKARCAKGQQRVKQRGQSRCVKKKKTKHPKKKQRQAGKSRRAAR